MTSKPGQEFNRFTLHSKQEINRFVDTKVEYNRFLSENSTNRAPVNNDRRDASTDTKGVGFVIFLVITFLIAYLLFSKYYFV